MIQLFYTVRERATVRWRDIASLPLAPGRDAMSACGRCAAVDGTGPDAAYAMPYSWSRRGYALYVRHVTMPVHTVYILLEPRV